MESRASRARAAVLSRLDEVIAGGAEAGALGKDLFAVATLLDREPALRRALTEPTVPAQARARLVRGVLEGQVSDAAQQVVAAAADVRWSGGTALADALEWAAVLAEATRAEQHGRLDELEDELFRFGRILDQSPELREALVDEAAPLDARTRLLEGLLQGRVTDSTLDLLRQLLVGRSPTLLVGLRSYEHTVAARRDRLVATAWVAAPLESGQRERMASALSAQYGHDVHLDVIVDPEVLGGVRIAIGDDVIDSSVSTRLAQAQRRVAG